MVFTLVRLAFIVSVRKQAEAVEAPTFKLIMCPGLELYGTFFARRVLFLNASGCTSRTRQMYDRFVRAVRPVCMAVCMCIQIAVQLRVQGVFLKYNFNILFLICVIKQW
jgi:hypothetical protein